MGGSSTGLCEVSKLRGFEAGLERCCRGLKSYEILFWPTILCYTILYYTILHYTILYYTILYYTILY